MGKDNSTQYQLKNFIDFLDSNLYSLVVAKFREITKALAHQMSRQLDEFKASSAEMSKLQEAYLRYKQLFEGAKDAEDSLKITLSLLLSIPQKVRAREKVDQWTLPKESDNGQDESAYIPVRVEDLDDFPLWKVIREIVRQTPEMRVVEVEDFLRNFGVRTSRQAIESALETHRDVFSTNKRGREKYVSLKGA